MLIGASPAVLRDNLARTPASRPVPVARVRLASIGPMQRMKLQPRIEALLGRSRNLKWLLRKNVPVAAEPLDRQIRQHANDV